MAMAMAMPFPAKVLIAAAAMPILLFPAFVVVCSQPVTLKLERSMPPHRQIPLHYLKARDSIRHGRKLEDAAKELPDGVLSLVVLGAFNPYLVGHYFTQVYLGPQEQQFAVQIDTGSDALWVGCTGCKGCPNKSGMGVTITSYDAKKYNTSKAISCSDKQCREQIKAGNAACNSQKNQCSYSIEYGDESSASGHYMQDQMTFLFYGDNRTTVAFPMLFGCTTKVTGDLTDTSRAVDGIMGLGRGENSIIKQLASQGVTPYVFSHCFIGSDAGGGVLAMGEILHPDIVYTPLVKNQPRYNVNLLSISVAGTPLPIDSSVFVTTESQGTIFDSGTTLAYLAEKAFGPFLIAITKNVAKSARQFSIKDNQCYTVATKIEDAFPTVSLNFEGGASMVLKPMDYLVEQNSEAENKTGPPVWCIGFQKIEGQQLNVLGDLVLKDKIIIYDLAHQRIGWANYNCSLGVNVSETARGQKGAKPPSNTNAMTAAKVQSQAASLSVKVVGYIATMTLFALML